MKDDDADVDVVISSWGWLKVAEEFCFIHNRKKMFYENIDSLYFLLIKHENYKFNKINKFLLLLMNTRTLTEGIC